MSRSSGNQDYEREWGKQLDHLRERLQSVGIHPGFSHFVVSDDNEVADIAIYLDDVITYIEEKQSDLAEVKRLVEDIESELHRRAPKGTG